MFGLNEVPDLSSDGVALKWFITREPISIFSQIKNVKGEEKKEKLNLLLRALRKNLPEGFKLGVAVGKGDCFFDSVAQGLNQLKDKGLITSSEEFSVKSLRKSCKRYAQQVNQSKKSSWLDNALKGEGEKLSEYIPRIEFTTEDIEGANSYSEKKVLKLENAILWGRSEIEGKMICEKYSVKIKIIKLKDEEIGGAHVTKGKLGTGNNIIYIVNYRNHFVPLLSNTKKDIKRSKKVSREEVYGNVVDSTSNNISQSYISTPLQDFENSSHEQSDHSRSTSEENGEIGRKRGRSVMDEDNKAPKRARMDVNVTSNEDSEFPSDLQDELDNSCQTNQYRNHFPHQLVGLMYRLDLSVLCSLKKSTYEHKYPSLSLAFEDSEIDKFNNIVLRYKEKSTHIQIENVDKHYTNNDINYAKLFTKGKSFSINNYIDSFVKHLISKLDNLLNNNIEYLIIYTNSALDLTEEKKLKKGRSRNFYPFKFDSINLKECDILKDFLFTMGTKWGDFYQFSQDKTAREELLKRLEFSPATQKVIKDRKLSQEELKVFFLDKLVFAVNQPNREELNRIIKHEIEKNNKVQNDYTTLQEEILHGLTAKEGQKKLVLKTILYEFSLLMSFLHDMFLHKKISSVNSEIHDISNVIALHYRDKVTYVKAHSTNSKINYNQLFLHEQQKKKTEVSINKQFTLFVEKLREDVEYFIIYTNVDLDITEGMNLKKGDSIKFDSIDFREKRYKVLRNCSCINENGLYQLSREEITWEKLLSLLKLPPSLQKEKDEGRFSSENEREIKEKFLDRLIFAVNQHDKEKLNSFIRNEIDKSNVPYNYEELHEIALRWSESHELGPIRKGVIKSLLQDIKNTRSSYVRKIQNKNINEEIKFAKSVVGKEGIPAFNQLLDFLIKGEGKKYLQVLKGKGIILPNISSTLHGAGSNALKAFKDLYDLWFDKQGNKTRYLKTLEVNGINLSNVSSILNGAGSDAAKAFKDLYDLWFDEEGSKKQYLKSLKENGIHLSNMSNILNGTGSDAAKAFKNLYDLWFDEEGNKTQYLETLEKEGINLSNVSSILGGAGTNAAKAFKELYDMWFDEEGNKTQYLKALEKEGINLSNISGILGGVGANAAKSFKDLYDVWFDKQGNKTRYLKALEVNGINLSNISAILSRVGTNAAEAFKDLHNLWFDETGNKTRYLKALEINGINLSNVSSILSRAGTSAAKAFKDLHDLWFDEEGSKTQYLKALEEEGINLSNMSGILGGVGANAPKAFKDLYDLWFDEKGNKKQYLKTLEKEEINLSNMFSILGEAGTNAAKAFKDLYDLCFDKKGNKKQYLKTLEKEGINLSNMSGILHRAGTNAAEVFKDLYDLWFDEKGNKKQYLKTLKKEGITLSSMFSIISGARVGAVKAFKDLYDVWFDEEGNKKQNLKTLEKEGINLCNISSILHGVGANAPRAFTDLYDVLFDEQGNKTQYLRHFIEKRSGEKKVFTLHNLSGMLSGAGSKIKDTFETLHSVCFNDKGKRTELLDDFYKAGFKPSNLSSILCGAGARISSILKNFHSVCFNEKKEKTKFLDNFYKSGFRPGDLCSMLSAAADCLEQFHDFCFIRKTKKYLNHFLNEEKGFTLSNLSEILHGARANICCALKDFHNICFDKTGNKTQLLDDFYEVGFRPKDLSCILSMAGSNATCILRNFHKLCFNEENYLNHFLAVDELFRPKDLSKILDRIGINICPIFEKLHSLCFDQVGDKTDYLKNLIENEQPKKIHDILYRKVRKGSPCVVSGSRGM